MERVTPTHVYLSLFLPSSFSKRHLPLSRMEHWKGHFQRYALSSSEILRSRTGYKTEWPRRRPSTTVCPAAVLFFLGRRQRLCISRDAVSSVDRSGVDNKLEQGKRNIIGNVLEQGKGIHNQLAIRPNYYISRDSITYSFSFSMQIPSTYASIM